MSTYNPWKNVTLNENVILGMETSGEDTNNLNANFLESGFIVAEVSPFDCVKGFFITVCDGSDSDDSFFPGLGNHLSVPTAQQAHDIVVALSNCETFDECKLLYWKLVMLANRNFKENQTLNSKGLDMDCREVKTTVTFLRYLDESEVVSGFDFNGDVYVTDCVIVSGGLRIRYDSREFLNRF